MEDRRYPCPDRSANRVIDRTPGRWAYLMGNISYTTPAEPVYVSPPTAGYSVNYVLTGRATFLDSRGRPSPVHRGSLFICAPGVSQTIERDLERDYHEFFIVFDPVLSDGLATLKFFPGEGVMTTSGSDDHLVRFSALLDIIATRPTEVPNSRVIASALGFVESLFADARKIAPPRANEQIREACRLIEADPSDRRPVAAIAEQVGLSYALFRREFKRMVGLSAQEYRIRARIDRACSMLARSTVSETANSLGYGDAFTFSNQFRQYVGRSPRDYKRSLA